MEQKRIVDIASVEIEARRLEENLQLVDNQILELEEFRKSFEFLIKSKNNEILASLGRGVFIKSEIKDKEKLFVEVGAGVVVMKTPEETLEIVKEQISRLQEARIQIASQLKVYSKQLQEFLESARGEK